MGNKRRESVGRDRSPGAVRTSRHIFAKVRGEKWSRLDGGVCLFCRGRASPKSPVVQRGRGRILNCHNRISSYIVYMSKVVALSGRVTSQKAGIRHLLVINRVRSDDVGTYMCYATNDIGSGQKGIVFDSQDITEPTKDNESGYLFFILFDLIRFFLKSFFL